jgi:hypothetical protein
VSIDCSVEMQESEVAMYIFWEVESSQPSVPVIHVGLRMGYVEFGDMDRSAARRLLSNSIALS